MSRSIRAAKLPASIALALLLALPASLAAVPVRAPTAADPTDNLAASTLASADATRELVEALADALGPGAAAGDRLLRAAYATSEPLQALRAPRVPLETAIVDLYAAGGLAPPASLAALPRELADALAPLVESIAIASSGVDASFARLSPDERAFLLEHVAVLVTPPEPDEASLALHTHVAALAARVDRTPMLDGAAMVANELAVFPRELRPFGPSAESTTCVDSGTCLIVVGDCGNDAYSDEAVLIVDLCGNERYDNHPGSYGPGSALPIPVSVVLDLGGTDFYSVGNADYDPASHVAWGDGVGIGGIGIVFDAHPDAYDPNTLARQLGEQNTHMAYLDDATEACSSLEPLYGHGVSTWQYLFAQGVGVLGVGALFQDVGGPPPGSPSVFEPQGETWYTAASTLDTVLDPANGCHFGRSHTFAQGVGMHFGVGVLFDDEGHQSPMMTSGNHYLARAYVASILDNIAHVYAQGAGGGGVGVLVDSGDYADDFQIYANAAEPKSTLRKGAMAFAFGQAAAFSTRVDPSGGQLAGTDVNNAVAPCGYGPQTMPRWPGQPTFNDQCDGAGVGLLIDSGDTLEGGGANRYVMDAGARNPQYCFYVWSATVGQGAAGWSGLAILADLGGEGGEHLFQQRSTSTGPCGYVGGIRTERNASIASTYGQGFAGPILWDWLSAPHADHPPHPLLTDTLQIAQDSNRTNTSMWTPPLGILVVANGPTASTGRPSSKFSADAVANTVGVDANAVAHAWVQGVGADLAATQRRIYPFVSGTPMGPAQVAGIPLGLGTGGGFLLNLGGDHSEFTAKARTVGPTAGRPGEPLAVAQGAGIDGVGALVVVRDPLSTFTPDKFTAIALQHGANAFPRSLAQAYADGTIDLAGPAMGTGISVPAHGILLDVHSPLATSIYSEGAQTGCQAPHARWGSILTSCSQGNGKSLGVDGV